LEGVTELALVFVFSLLGLIAAVRLRLPPVMGILLAGALIGPNALGWIKSSEMIDSFSEIGAILLLFVIGIEFSLNKIIRFGVRAILVAILKITFVFAIIYEAAILLGLTSLEALIIGNIFAITSTTLFAKLIKGSPDENKDEINLMFAVLIIEDILAVFFLTVVSSLPGESAIAVNELVFSIVKSLIILSISYVILQKAIRAFFDYILKFKTEEMLVFASLSVCAIFAFLSSAIGLEASIGAFLAGSLMASLKEFKKIERTILPFGLFFSSFFFLSIGMLVNFGSLSENFVIIAVLIIVSMAAKFASISTSTYFLGYTSRAAIFAGVTMLTVGEFSLLIAKKAQMFISFDIIGTVSVSVFITALLSAIIIRKDYEIDNYITSSIPPKLKTAARHISRYLNSVVVEFEPTGRFFRTSMKEITNIIVCGVLLLIINGVLLFAGQFFESTKLISFDGLLFWVRILVHLVISLGLLFRFFTSLDVIVSALMDAFRKLDKKNIPLEKRVVYDAITTIVLLMLSSVFPFVSAIFSLPPISGIVSFILVILAVLYTWDAIKCTHQLVLSLTRKKKSYNPGAKLAVGKKVLGILAMFLNV